jgi:hypothetical protein
VKNNTVPTMSARFVLGREFVCISSRFPGARLVEAIFSPHSRLFVRFSLFMCAEDKPRQGREHHVRR